MSTKICMIRAGVDQEQGILGLDIGVFTSRISAIALRPTDRRKL
ncbi:MAG: hypothetical protein QOI36_4634 [Pseudonocardiales bacterium]|jgi:hypothetical protein|nr:hypothetical protein [Pseudonocardia sp.]MDT7653228.1 hypothetical protein [Pseudonocardiales bacterium]